MMCQCSFTGHLVLVSCMYKYVCMMYACTPHNWSERGCGGNLALPNPGVCNQYAWQWVRMPFAGNQGGLAGIRHFQ